MRPRLDSDLIDPGGAVEGNTGEGVEVENGDLVVKSQTGGPSKADYPTRATKSWEA